MTPLLAITEQIRKAVRLSGRSLRELARVLGIDHSQLSRFVRGERGLKLETLDRLADELGLRIEEERTED